MKKTAFLLMAALMLLCACKKQETAQVYTVESYGKTYTVDQGAQTVTYDGVSYTFDVQAHVGSGYTVSFTAPDGSTASWEQNGQFASGSRSSDWNEDVWPSDLADAVTKNVSRSRERKGNPLVGLLLIAVGVFHVAAPRAAWYLSHGWRYKNAEPSETALAVGGVGGVAAILLGLVLCII